MSDNEATVVRRWTYNYWEECGDGGVENVRPSQPFDIPLAPKNSRWWTRRNWRLSSGQSAIVTPKRLLAALAYFQSHRAAASRAGGLGGTR